MSISYLFKYLNLLVLQTVTLQNSVLTVALVAPLLCVSFLDAKPPKINGCKYVNFQVWNKLDKNVTLQLTRIFNMGRAPTQDELPAGGTKKIVTDGYQIPGTEGTGKYFDKTIVSYPWGSVEWVNDLNISSFIKQFFRPIIINAGESVERAMREFFVPLPDVACDLIFEFGIAGVKERWRVHYEPKAGMGTATALDGDSLYLRLNKEGSKYVFGPQQGPRLIGAGKTESGCPVSKDVEVAKLPALKM